MRNFTKLWQWMMILIISSSVSVLQAQTYSESVLSKEATVNSEMKIQIEKGSVPDYLNWPSVAGILSEVSLTEPLEGETLQMIAEILQNNESANEVGPELVEQMKEVISGLGVQYGMATKPSPDAQTIKNPDASITVTLGTDATYNTTTGAPTPYGTYYKNFRQQYLILASELIQLGIGAGDITELGFEVFALNNCVSMPNYTIQIKHTIENALTTAFDNGTYQTVWTDLNFLPVVGWNMHPFTTPFTWDGVQNILIDICSDIIPGAYTQNASVFYTVTPGVNTCLRYQSDTQVACGTNSAGTLSSNRANMRITGEEMLNPPPQMPHSPSPANLAVNVPVDDTLSWMFGTNTTTYDLFLDTSYPPAIKVVDNQPANNPGGFDPGTLSYSTTYYWQVVAHNANGTTNGPIWNFATACGTIIAPFAEHFQNPVIPNCWVMFGPQNWLFTTTWPGYGAAGLQDHTGTGGSFAGVDGSGSAGISGITLETPFIDVTALTNPQLRFYLFNNNINNSDWQSLRVDLWNGTAWNDSIYLWGPTDNDPDWVEVEVLLAPYTITGNIQFRFIVDKSTGSPFYDDLIIDDIFVEEAPACPKPTLLGATNITMSTADLTWYSLSGLSDIEFGPAGFTPTGVPTYAGVVSPYAVTGLTGSTAYAFYVRDNCGAGQYSNWAGPFVFYTMPGSQSLPVYENFEAGFVHFDNGPGNGVNWVINTSYYKSGVQSAHNPYDNANQNVLHETGVLDLSTSAIVFLEFWHIAKTENNYDHCYVEISTDGGSTYTILPQSTYLGTGIYNTPLYNNPAGPAFNEMSYPEWGGTASIPPDNTWWQHETFDLSDYLTTNVRIRFRLHSDGSVLRYGWLIDDILIYEPAYGILSGTVTEASTTNPIQGAVVQVGISASATTGSDGTYTLPGILTGSWDVTCTATGYNPQTAAVVILENQTTTQNFALTAPNMVLNPLVVNETLEMGETADVLVNISNTGTGELSWNASLVILTNTSPEDTWDLQMSLDLEQATGALGNAGSECDGTYFYSTRWATNLIHRFDLSGNLVEEFSIPGVNGLRDLAFDGTYMYGGAAATTIYEMDFVNKTLIGTINSPQQVRSIAYDEASDAFWCANWATDITLVSKSGTSLGSFPAAVHGLAGIYGTAYDNWTAGGPYLWIFDQGSGAGLPQLIHQANLGTTTMTGFSYDVLTDLGPNASAIAGGLFTVPNIFAGTVTIGGLLQGTPDVLFCYELAPYSTWISISPTSGTLAPATNQDMTVHLDATDIFIPGVYEAEIHFSSTPNVGTYVVDVTMTVGGLIPPVNLVVSHSCTDVNLVWEMPTGGNPDSWNVYRDGAMVGNTTGMTYTDPMMMPQQEYCYHITAVYAGDESMPTQPGCITVPMPANLQPVGLDGTPNVPNPENITLTWNLPTGCLTPDGYNVYRDGDQINTELITELIYVDELLVSGLYQYQVSAVYYLGESPLSAPKFILIVITGVETVDALKLQMFPNPATSHVHIQAEHEMTRVVVYDHAGKIVNDNQVNGLFHRLDISTLQRGLYLIRIETAKGYAIRKLTIN
ncbi:MAG: carboxypeptidase regulatory-like domain-containing protein [Bacteroidales bacterium]